MPLLCLLHAVSLIVVAVIVIMVMLRDHNFRLQCSKQKRLIEKEYRLFSLVCTVGHLLFFNTGFSVFHLNCWQLCLLGAFQSAFFRFKDAEDVYEKDCDCFIEMFQ